MKVIHVIAWILLVIGGLNWFSVGLGWGDFVMGWFPSLANIIFVLVGLAALWELFTHWKNCRACKGSM